MVQKRISETTTTTTTTTTTDSSMDNHSDCEGDEEGMTPLDSDYGHRHLSQVVVVDELKIVDRKKNSSSSSSSCLSSPSSSCSMIMSDCASSLIDNDHTTTMVHTNDDDNLGVVVNGSTTSDNDDDVSGSEESNGKNPKRNTNRLVLVNGKHGGGKNKMNPVQPNSVDSVSNRNCTNGNKNEAIESHNRRRHHHNNNHHHNETERIKNNCIVVPRTVPCVVLTQQQPPALFSPRIPLLTNVESDVGGMNNNGSGKSLPLPDPAAFPSTAAAAAAAAAFSSFHFSRLVSSSSSASTMDNNNAFDGGINLKIGGGGGDPLKPFKSGQNPSISHHHHHHQQHQQQPSSVDFTVKKTMDVVEEVPSRKLTFGIDRILAEEERGAKHILDVTTTAAAVAADGAKLTGVMGHPADFTIGGRNFPHHQQVQGGHHHHHHHGQPAHQNPSANDHHNHHHHNPAEDHQGHGGGRGFPSQCSECFFLSRYCRRIQFPTNTPPSVSTSFTWLPSPSSGHLPHPSVVVDSSNPSSLLNSNGGFGHHVNSYGLNGSSFSTMSTMVSCNTSGNGRRKRSWSRAVFSNLQRKGLEKRFQLQKYITKPDRRQLAATLGLTDAQVKVWFQNRRMKWRHSKEGKQGHHIPEESVTVHASDAKK